MANLRTPLSPPMQFKSQELASSLWALANLRTLLPRSFINAFFYASFPKLAFFNAQVDRLEREGGGALLLPFTYLHSPRRHFL